MTGPLTGIRQQVNNSLCSWFMIDKSIVNYQQRRKQIIKTSWLLQHNEILQNFVNINK